jgi:hypothetical protein
MKHVVKKSEVAHLWANKVQSDARNAGGNFYFDNETIYSYGSHFPIAKHATNERGERAVLFTERKYSNTTSKHLNATWSACRHLNVIDCWDPHGTHDQNFSSWANTAKMSAEKLLKAKKPEIYLNQLAEVKLKAEKYADFFNITMPRDLQDIINVKDKREFAEFAAKEAEYRAEQEKIRQAELKAKHKKELAKWLKGETNRLYIHNGYDYLRTTDSCTVQTSQGVDIPISIAENLWWAIVSKKLPIGAKVLHYTVNQFDDKLIKIGCHTFKTDYLVKFGNGIFQG